MIIGLPNEISERIRRYSRAAYLNDLRVLRNVWSELQECRHRDAVYIFLDEVFRLVSWWLSDKEVQDRAFRRLITHGVHPSADIEPFAKAILAAADETKVDKRTVSKWARVLRLAHEIKPPHQSLESFVKQFGGLNGCAGQYARRLGRLAKKIKRPTAKLRKIRQQKSIR